METKFTQGEWVISKYAETTIESDGRTIASSGSYYDGTEETHNENIANAKLIAAAPELLNALIDYVETSKLPGVLNTEYYEKLFTELIKTATK